MSKQEWRNYAKIRNFLLLKGGVIFGGAVRDELLHNMCAAEFYRQQTEYYKYHPEAEKNKLFEYNNKKISPETIDRLTIPYDIDVIIEEEKREQIIHYFTKYYKTQICKVKDLHYFKTDVPPNIYTLYKIELTTLFNKVYYVVKVDLISVNNNSQLNEIPLDYDFDVNSLFWNKNGIYSKININRSNFTTTTMHNSLLLHSVFNNIRNKVANMNHEFLWGIVKDGPVKIIKERRIQKLIQKGWKIHIPFSIYNFYKSANLSDDESCMLCLKNKKEIKECVNFKNCICKSFICLECIKTEYTKIMKCPTCRNVIMETNDSLLYAKNELTVYQKYIM